MKLNLPALTSILMFIVLAAAPTTRAETPKEAVGFNGTVTGVVQSAKDDGSSFVLKVTSDEPDAAKSTVKDGAPMAGKEITLGVRMPRKDGKPYPHPDDVAWIKGLKQGQSITVKVFAVQADPKVLRIQGPGKDAEQK
jgi:hypothetical protein